MLKACLINRFKQCTAVGIVGSVGVYVYACAFVGVNEYARWVIALDLASFHGLFSEHKGGVEGGI